MVVDVRVVVVTDSVDVGTVVVEVVLKVVTSYGTNRIKAHATK